MLRFLRLAAPGASDQLPLPVLAELVDMMFAGLAPIVAIGCAALCIGLFIAFRDNDRSVLSLTIGSVFITLIRVFITLGYRRRKRAPEPVSLAMVRCWERRYGVGTICFALTISLLAFRTLRLDDPYAPMLMTGLLFGYVTGQLSRIAVRPAICGVSVLTTTALSCAAYFLCMLEQPNFGDGIAYLAEVLLMVGLAVVGMQTMMQSYDMTVRQLLTNRDLAAMAGQDMLTSLPNRLLLRSRFAESLAHGRQAGHLVAVHCLDLDRFKAVNDTLGHPAGDALLQAVGKRLLRALKDGDTAARIGGDEFVIVQGGVRETEEALLLAQRIIRVISAPYNIQGNDVRIGVSIGIALTTPEGGSIDELLARADEALYLSKGRKRGGVSFWGEAAGGTSTVASFAA